jgi:Tol biopolymer transport system component
VRVSVGSTGNQGNQPSGYWHPAISANGLCTAFDSWASNLVPGDTNGYEDIFVHDATRDKTVRASVDGAGNQTTDGPSWSAAINEDCRYIAFQTSASNLVPGDSNGSFDVFVHDQQSGETERVSVDSQGRQAGGASGSPKLSSDARYVAFYSTAEDLVVGDDNHEDDVFVHDRQTGETKRVSVDSAGRQADGYSEDPAISSDGRYVAFDSNASNLVADDTNGAADVFVHDTQTGIRLG